MGGSWFLDIQPSNRRNQPHRACAKLRHRQGHSDALRLWASRMLERKMVKYKFNLTAVALANKVARIVFVLMTRGGQYD